MKKLFLTLSLLTCTSLINTATPIAIKNRCVMLPPCKIQQFPYNKTAIIEDTEKKTLTFSYIRSQKTNPEGQETYYIKVSCNKCRHESFKNGFINYYTGNPRCIECSQIHDQWIKDLEGT